MEKIVPKFPYYLSLMMKYSEALPKTSTTKRKVIPEPALIYSLVRQDDETIPITNGTSRKIIEANPQSFLFILPYREASRLIFSSFAVVVEAVPKFGKTASQTCEIAAVVKQNQPI
jgi:hypothetical protein